MPSNLNESAAGQTLVETRAYGTALAEAYATHTYTPNGKEASIADALGHTTQYAYDGFDRLSATTFPDGSAEQIAAYDADGNIQTRINRGGRGGAPVQHHADFQHSNDAAGTPHLCTGSHIGSTTACTGF